MNFSQNRWIYVAIGGIIGVLFLYWRISHKDAPEPIWTLEQAQVRYSHRILVPKEIPLGFHLLGVRVSRGRVIEGDTLTSPRPSVPLTDRMGFVAIDNWRTAPYLMAMHPTPCSPSEKSGIRMGDKILSIGDNHMIYSLKRKTISQFSTIGKVILGRMRRNPGDLFQLVYQHEEEPPKTWKSPLPKPYRPCFDRKPSLPTVVALLYESSISHGGFDVLEQEAMIDPTVGSDTGGIDIGGGRRYHPAGSTNRPGGSWTQNGLDLQILNMQGLLTPDQLIALARSTS